MPRRKAITAKSVQSTEDIPFDLPDITIHAETDNDPWDGATGLTIRQHRFVHYYCGECAGNATNAAELAGYNSCNRESLRATASEILIRPNVQRAIERKMAEGFGSPEDVEKSIASIARGTAASYIVRNPATGKLETDLEAMARDGQLGLIKEIKEEGFETSEGPVIIKRTFKMYDKLRALELLAKINGQLVDRHEHSGPNGKAIPVQHKIVTDDDILTASRIGRSTVPSGN